jgi:carboxylesterase
MKKLKKYSQYQNPHLPGGTINHNGNNVGFLLIHGFTATTAEVRFLADHFIEKGCTVIAPLLPGHGTEPSDLNKQKFTDWINCVEKYLIILQNKCESVIVGGESMGGVLGLYLAENHPDIAALLLYSTALLVEKLKYARLLKFTTSAVEKNKPDNGLPWQGYDVYPLWAADQFHRLTKKVKNNISRVEVPTIIFQGNFDKTIDKRNIQFIYDGIQSKNKEMVVMKKSGHVMLLDQEISFIKQKTQTFLQGLEIFK